MWLIRKKYTLKAATNYHYSISINLEPSKEIAFRFNFWRSLARETSAAG